MATKRKAYGQGCNCKNTNCMNRNCVCFAAKLYCTGACSCKECFNRLDYQDKVDVAREEALHRNPYAFTSKEGREKQKKGCACRVLNCSQNKCNCYKNEIGCRGECQCVGCQNVHGKRGDNFDMTSGTDPRLYSDMVPVNQFIHMSSVTNIPYMQSPPESSNHDMTLATGTRDSDMVHVDQREFMSPFTPQDINASHPSSVTNLPNILSQAESSYLDMMIGTSTREYELNLPTVDQLEYMNRCRPQDFDASDDDRKL